MATLIQAWQALGPRLISTEPVMPETVIEQLVLTTNQSRGSVLAVLSELDVLIEQALKEGRIVRLPNGTHYWPYGKKDGSIRVHVRVNPRVTQRVSGEFRGGWLNAERIGLTSEEITAMWNEAHPDDPIA